MMIYIYYAKFQKDVTLVTMFTPHNVPYRLRKPQKNVLLLMAGQLRPNPPPSSLMAVGTLEKKI